MTTLAHPELDQLAAAQREAGMAAVKGALASVGVLAPAIAAFVAWRGLRRQRRQLAAQLAAAPRDEHPDEPGEDLEP